MRYIDIKASDIWDTIVFWPGYWFRYMTTCLWGRHRWWLLQITDGSTSVWCHNCRATREPTEEEKAQHSHAKWSKEEQEAYDQRVKLVQDALDKYLAEGGEL
jgi:hypothetical protein